MTPKPAKRLFLEVAVLLLFLMLLDVWVTSLAWAAAPSDGAIPAHEIRKETGVC